MTLSEMIRRVDSLDIKANLPEMVNNTKEEMADLNISQLELGQEKTGNPITPEYRSELYADFKKSIGSKAPEGTPNLKLTGSFYDGINVQLNGMEYFISSTDGKMPDLVEKYGDDIFGLSEENKSKYALDVLYYEIREYIRKTIGI